MKKIHHLTSPKMSTDRGQPIKKRENIVDVRLSKIFLKNNQIFKLVSYIVIFKSFKSITTKSHYFLFNDKNTNKNLIFIQIKVDNGPDRFLMLQRKS